MTVETLAAQLRQCREALDRCVAECSMRFDLLCAIGEATAFPVPSPADLATLARQAEIGALVERMPDGMCLQHGDVTSEWVVFQEFCDDFTYGDATPLDCLRAALTAEDKEPRP